MCSQKQKNKWACALPKPPTHLVAALEDLFGPSQDHALRPNRGQLGLHVEVRLGLVAEVSSWRENRQAFRQFDEQTDERVTSCRLLLVVVLVLLVLVLVVVVVVVVLLLSLCFPATWGAFPVRLSASRFAKPSLSTPTVEREKLLWRETGSETSSSDSPTCYHHRGHHHSPYCLSSSFDMPPPLDPPGPLPVEASSSNLDFMHANERAKRMVRRNIIIIIIIIGFRLVRPRVAEG